MAEIPAGTKREEALVVTTEEAISFLGLDSARVLSTPQMILQMERTSRNAVLPLLDPGHDTVGTHVNVYHLAAAPLGSRVIFHSEVLWVEDRRIQFKVEAVDEKGVKIGEGTHERRVIDIARFAEKMERAKAGLS
ncbi:MAG: hotdog domain-containing protein [Bryobacteraceae bacterium]